MFLHAFIHPLAHFSARLSIHPPINPFIHLPTHCIWCYKRERYACLSLITILTVSPANGLLSPKNSLNTSSASPWNVYPLTKSGVARTRSNYLSINAKCYSSLTSIQKHYLICAWGHVMLSSSHASFNSLIRFFFMVIPNFIALQSYATVPFVNFNG